MNRLLILLGTLSVVAACATPTPYQPAVGTRWGYEESQIESNRFRVSFGGNSLTDRETVETYLIYRAAELTVENGYDYFEVVTRALDEESRFMGTPDPYRHQYRGFPVHYAFFHPRWGWRAHHDPFWDDVNYREVTRYEASAEIVFGRGRKPDHAGAFDARDVMRNLGERIMRPEMG
jgi:hypothetical protein